MVTIKKVQNSYKMFALVSRYLFRLDIDIRRLYQDIFINIL